MTKRKDAEILLSLPLPTELRAIIATYYTNWCGCTEQDAYKLLRMWQFAPKQLNDWPSPTKK